MKKIFFLILTLFAFNISYSQIKQRTVNTAVYAGLGYKFVFLTNPSARNAYPFFQLSSGDFLKEIDGIFGVTINESYAVELAPAYLFTGAVSSDGFYFTNAGVTQFYEPIQTRLFALPLNIKFKYYPFAKNYTSTLSKFYFGAGGGALYINEEVTSRIYSDENRSNYLGAVNAKSNSWTSNYEMFVGIGSFSKIGYGFELSYRFVPLKENKTKPLITEIVSNFNSVNLAANIIFTF